MNERYYTAQEAQQKLGLSRAVFFRMVSQGIIPKFVQPGMKQGIYPRRDIDALALSMGKDDAEPDKFFFTRSSPADQLEEMNIGIKCFGRNFITPLPDRIAFQQKADLTFHSLKVDGHIVGYVSLFHFPPDFLDDLLSGRKIERDITIKHVLPFVRLEPFSIYVDVIAVDPDLPSHLRHTYAGIITSNTIDVVLNLIANGYQITDIYTVTATQEGDNLVRKLGFSLMEEKSIAPERRAYVYPINPASLQRFRIYQRRALRS